MTRQTELQLNLNPNEEESLPSWVEGLSVSDRPRPSPLRPLQIQFLLFDISPYHAPKTTKKANRADRNRQATISTTQLG